MEPGAGFTGGVEGAKPALGASAALPPPAAGVLRGLPAPAAAPRGCGRRRLELRERGQVGWSCRGAKSCGGRCCGCGG